MSIYITVGAPSHLVSDIKFQTPDACIVSRLKERGSILSGA